MISVLVAEDSQVITSVLKTILESDDEIRVVGTVTNGVDAVRLAKTLRPDVITMDMRMPKMDGVEATKLIMSQAPTRIIVVSDSGGQGAAQPAFEAIKAGVLTLIPKPRGLGHRDFGIVSEQLIKTIKLMSTVKVITRWPRSSNKGEKKRPSAGKGKIIVMGSSTGGPGALSAILKDMPADLSVPIVIVQHMASGFGSAFSSWLNGETNLSVTIAKHNEPLRPGHVFVAPDNFHIAVSDQHQLSLTQKQVSYNHYTPSINHLFHTTAKLYGPETVGVLLTGMGEDGAQGLKEIKVAGGRTLAQDEKTSVVFGMPKSAVSLEAVDYVLPLEKISARLLSWL